MIIVLLLFFKSICLYCQRIVLHIHDRWINPKNVRLLKEAAEAQGSKFQIEEYRRIKKSKKRRYAAGSPAHSQSSNSLADSVSCRFCANTPQGYCRHHFHLQELHVQKQQRQQKFWCPLSGVVAGPNRTTELRQLRKIKRELKRTIQHQQELKLAKTATSLFEHNPPRSISTNSIPSTRADSSYSNNDSGYQTLSANTSAYWVDVENSEFQYQQLQTDSAIAVISNTTSDDFVKLQTDSATAVTSNTTSDDFVNIELPSPSASLVETTYSFETCCETLNHQSSPTVPRNSSFSSFVSCEYSTLSTTYL